MSVERDMFLGINGKGAIFWCGFWLFFLSSQLFAGFHSQPLQCNNCHTIHNFAEGISESGGNPNTKLLKKANGCRGCHDGSMMVAGAPDVFSNGNSPGTPNEAPAGSFFEILSGGNDQKGHNPQDCGIPADGVLNKTPPGALAALTSYSCTSCHDPHGGSTVNSYKLLKKKPGNYVGADLIVSGIKSDIVLAGMQVSQTVTNHNVYQSGFSAWCAGCHGTFVAAAGNAGIHHGTCLNCHFDNTVEKHPTDSNHPGAIFNNYGAMTDFRMPLMNAAYTLPTAEEPRAAGRLFCLTCHKVHASPYNDSCRWNKDAPQAMGAGVVSCERCHQKGG